MRRTLTAALADLQLLIRSGHPVIYIVSHEEARVRHYVTRIVQVLLKENPSKKLFAWYEGEGLKQCEGLQPVRELNAIEDWLGGDPAQWKQVPGAEQLQWLNCIRDHRGPAQNATN